MNRTLYLYMIVAVGMILQAHAASSPLLPERIYLSGTDAASPTRWGFFCTGGQNSNRHDSIDVPCNWELQGYGDYTYGRWYKNKGEKPSDETGIYTLDFDVPVEATDRRVNIVFDGVMTDCLVKVNNIEAYKRLLQSGNIS
ncbi:MAG: hypothetical protein J1E63_05890, partial [Muribaculaceae bacterium]|nr:hypothetical protein [Muribaculaceae bacterium]